MDADTRQQAGAIAAKVRHPGGTVVDDKPGSRTVRKLAQCGQAGVSTGEYVHVDDA